MIKYLLSTLFALLFFVNVEAQQEDLKINPFLTEEERERFKEKSKYEVLLGPNLSAILYSPGNSKAVIDGRIVREGDIIDGKTVLKIHPNSVILTDLQHKFILQISAPATSVESEMVKLRKDKDE